jgi:3-hydroxyisobutyrate dehydrogenase-like beta-hydroxyacid dehydrogenase
MIAGVRIGLVHPGQMGASVGAAAVGSGHEVVWASAGRSAASRRRADDAGLVDAGSLAALLARVDLVLSVVPPEAAVAVAEQVAADGFAGTYVDANAVAPATARRIDGIIAGGSGTGGGFVDGAIIGGPVGSPGGTRLYLAGGPAAEVAAVFDGSGLEAIVLPGPPGAAAAVKAAYAGWTKGSAALVLALRALARAEGVEPALLAELSRSLPELPAQADRAARGAAAKAWRWAGEMDEIAAAFAADDLPAGFHQAAADIYRRVGPPATHTTDTVIDLITRTTQPRPPD